MSALIPGKRYRVIRDGVADRDGDYIRLDTGALIHPTAANVTVEGRVSGC